MYDIPIDSGQIEMMFDNMSVIGRKPDVSA